MKDFLAIVFASRDYAHKMHLNTDSFAQHEALGGFYGDVIGLADKLAETWQGRHGKKIGDIPTYESKATGKPVMVLKRHLAEIEKLRENVAGDDSVLNNIVDEIVGLYLTTIYKLTFLG